MSFENASKSTVTNIITRLAGMSHETNGDYVDAEGIMRCGVCGKAKQAWIDWLPTADGQTQKMLVPVICACQKAEDDKQRAADKKEQFDISLQYAREKFGIQPRTSYSPSFADDDDPTNAISRACRLYVKEWQQMRQDNTGIIFYGSKGTGKSFYAECIVNALADQLVPTAITSTANLMGALQSNWNKNEIMENLNCFSLLVLDDVGTERDTSYAAELMYAVIDARYRAKKPLIVTTNLDIQDMQAETDLWRSRIYDRILEMCAIPIRMDGASRRTAIAEGRKQRAKDILRRAKA